MLDTSHANKDTPRKIRCAVYTRKSTEEGLEQHFNSLHAQREACEAYIASQKHEGWVLLPQAYDDGGVSGGTLERPGVQQLLADVDAGLVDQTVVYKVDRLTRSLTDFSKLVERLDTAGASFVSVTQSFNTATSMGRLTLNMLLSFAQFEREVTAERIRDKIAASKAKGLWMGGAVPYGFSPNGRSLDIREDEAANVRWIFEQVAGGASMVDLADQCAARGIKTRFRKQGKSKGSDKDKGSSKGKMTSGLPFSRGHLYQLISNPIYIGKIRHKGKIHEGQHEAIIDQELWDRVQAILTERCNGKRKALAYRASTAPLLGKLFDAVGQTFVVSHSRKQGRRHEYYVSRPGPETNAAPLMRYRTKMLEQTIGAVVYPIVERALIGTARANLLEAIRPDDAKTWATMLERIELQPGKMKVVFTEELRIQTPQEFAFTQRRQNKEMRIILDGADQPLDTTLLSNLATGRALYKLIKNGKTTAEAAEHFGLDQRWAGRLLQMAFLNPHIIERAATGALPPSINTASFVDKTWPVGFKAQAKLLDLIA